MRAIQMCPIQSMLRWGSGCTFGPLASQMSPVVSEQTGNAPVQTSSSVCTCSKPATNSNSCSVQIINSRIQIDPQILH